MEKEINYEAQPDAKRPGCAPEVGVARSASRQSGLTDDEIKKLAEDIYRDRVFTSDHVRKGDLDMISMIFMPLIFADKEMIDGMKDCGMLYEYMDKAGDRGINGYPIFLTFHVVNKEDSVKVWKRVSEIKKAVDGVDGVDKKEPA